MKPLEGLLVLEFSQYLSGPSATLRLADLGARVIKIERPQGGDGNRKLSLGVEWGDDTLLFQTINRNKESYAVNMKQPRELQKVRKLVAQADVLVENFRPGVMEKLGMDYASTQTFNPGLVYGRITGYGDTGPWKTKPGQDLLVQSLSGLAWINGNADQPPTPFALAVADMMAGAHLAQGILAALVRRGRSGKGALVEVSLMESILDMQFEVLTTFLNDGGKLPQRSTVNNAHAYLAAPYGIYETQDGYLALAMGSIERLAELLDCPRLLEFVAPAQAFTHRDAIKRILVDHLKTRTTGDWLGVLEPADYWCSDVLTWDRLFREDGFSALDMVQEVVQAPVGSFKTTRCPIRVDGEIYTSAKGAPRLGQHTAGLDEEFSLSES